MFSTDLLSPYIKITLGKIGSLKSEVFEIGKSKLVSCSVFLGEGKNQSNCRFAVRDEDRKLLDKYLAYIESVDGLDGFKDYPDKTEYPEVTANPPQDQAVETDGKLIFASTQATVFSDGVGSRGNQLDTLNTFGCAMRYNNPAAARQFGSVGMISYLNFGDSVRVTNPANGKSCICTIQDWGPNPRLASRGIDLFTKAFNYLTNTTGLVAANNIGVLNNIKVELVTKRSPTVVTTPKTQEQKKKAEEITANRAKTSASANTSIDKVKSSVNTAKTPKQESLPTSSSRSGCQITVELGFDGKTISAYSFIHTSLNFDFFDPNLLVFGGTAATWVMGQRVKNTVYTKMTFRKVAEKICKAYGLNLVMSEPGPYYEYFPQKSQSDYEFLITEAKRLGFRVTAKGKILTIQSRAEAIAKKETFILKFGENMGLDFKISHTAGSDSSGGARSSQPGSNNATGELKFELDPDTGEFKQQVKENLKGIGADTVGTVSGSSLPTPKPKTDSATTSEDNQRKANEERIKGIKASASFPTYREALVLNPDTAFQTKGVSVASDRFWVVDNVEHNYELSSGFRTSVSLYSPLKNKAPTSKIDSPVSSSSSKVATNTPTGEGFDPSAPKFIRPAPGPYSSLHRTENPRRPRHKGIDVANNAGTPIISSAAGVVNNVVTGCKIGNFSCGGGYGSRAYIDHGGGWQTRYAHLSSVAVTNGQTVVQGQVIGTMGNTGHSFGVHLHFEIRKNGNDLNPRKFTN